VGEDSCAICLADASVEVINGDLFQVTCSRCGDYRIVGTARSLARSATDDSEVGKPRLGPKGSRKRANASAWIREHPGGGALTSDKLAALASLRSPRITDRLRKLISGLARTQETTASLVDTSQPDWEARTWSLDHTDLSGLLRLASQRGLLVGQFGALESNHMTMAVQLTAAGWELAESLMAINPNSPQGYIAMSFDDSMTPAYDEAIAPAIEVAGYSAHRVDRREHVGRVDDEILAQIRRSRFVVADFTGHRGGVY
jgi:hypothetical protein